MDAFVRRSGSVERGRWLLPGLRELTLFVSEVRPGLLSEAVQARNAGKGDRPASITKLLVQEAS